MAFVSGVVFLSRFAAVSMRSGFAAEKSALLNVVAVFHELQDTLEAGLLPAPERWSGIGRLPAPWGELSKSAVEELRRQGAPVVPTMRRLRALAAGHSAALDNARARASQSLAQAVICALMAPLFGGALYLLLPGLDARPWLWCAVSAAATVLASASAVWITMMAREARWGGLRGNQKKWWLASQCAGEYFLALVRAGSASDIAWTRACESLTLRVPDLAVEWGASVWGSGGAVAPRAGARGSIIEAGMAIRRAVQTSLMEGRPCTERVEAVLAALGSGLGAHVERELSLLQTRALKPLFLLVAPALVGLLAAGILIGALGGGVIGGGF